jgi:drug/metabolite transporter (DMT)-like permease
MQDKNWLRAMPWVFVLIWSTGFIVARYGMPHAPPMSFLWLRFLLSIVCFLVWVRVSKVAWPLNRVQWFHIGMTGLFMHVGYLGGVWTAVKAGMGSGLVALIVGLQPILTALWVSGRGSRIHTRQWAGLGLGFGGLALVVWHKLGAGEANALNLSLTVLAMLSITVGTLYQKHFVQPCDVRTANAVQLMVAFMVVSPLAWLETEPMVWNPELIGAMAWSVLAVTLGGSSLLFMLIQRGAATAVTSLLYLVPPTTALMAWVLFDEQVTLYTLLGTALAAWGVSWVVRTPPSQA